MFIENFKKGEMKMIEILIYVIILGFLMIVMSILLIVQNIIINKKLEQERKEIQEWLKNKI